jgi:Uma2 family endonuclease
MGQLKSKENVKFTYSDYLTWPENERWEIINGDAYMCAAPSRTHQKYLGVLFMLISQYLEDKTCEVYTAPFDVRFPKVKQKDEETDTVVQPDIVVVCDLEKLDEKGCKGAPDLVIEILSPATISIDYISKLHIYEKNGVPEYWVVHPTDKTLMVFLLNKVGKYERGVVYTEKDKVRVNILEDLTIDLSRVFK